MPLPTNDSPWPPKAWHPIRDDIAEWNVWYSGNADQLSAFYAPASKDQRRWRIPFWGRPPQDPNRPDPKRIHLPLTASIAAASADLLFGDPPTFEAGTATDHLAALLASNGAVSLLLEGAELASGLGGVYLVPAWDTTVADQPILRVVDPDLAVPEFRAGVLTAVTLWTDLETDTDGKVWRHLERYETTGDRSLILHGLYCGTADTLGYRMPLTAKAETKHLAGDTGDGIVDLTDQLGGVTRCAASWVPNIRPNRKRRRHPLGRWMGRSDTAGLESLMASLDRAWSSLDRDIDLGKARIIAPDQYLQRGRPGQGAWFDADQEVFSPLDVPPGAAREAIGVELVQPDIRTAALVDAARALFDAVVADAGYSTASLGRDAENGVKTATQVDAEDSLSTRTTMKKRGYWTPRLAETAEMLLAIDRHVFGQQVEVNPIEVVWPEPDPDPDALAARLNLWAVARAASVETRVRTLHPGWDDSDVAAEVARIAGDESVTVDDPAGRL